MRLRPESPFVLYTADPITVLGRDELAELSQRGRVRLCTHPGPDAKLHEMIIVHQQGQYVRPHRQRQGKSESLHLMAGELDMVFFEEDGTIREVLPMGDLPSGKPCYYRVNEPIYHTQIIRSPWVTFHEITGGPFLPGDTEWAPWAPPEAEAEAYRAELANRLAAWR